MSGARLVMVTGALLGAVPAVRAQIPLTEYRDRRDSLAARIGDGVVVAFGGRTPITDFGPFYQLAGFRYLTGYDFAEATLVMVVRGGRCTMASSLTRARSRGNLGSPHGTGPNCRWWPIRWLGPG